MLWCCAWDANALFLFFLLNSGQGYDIQRRASMQSDLGLSISQHLLIASYVP